MNAAEQTESPTFEDVNENKSSGSAETASGSAEAASGSAETASGSAETASGSAETASGSAETASGSAEAASGSAETASGSVEAASGSAETDSGSVEPPPANSPESNSSSSNSNATVKANKKGMSVAAKTVLSDRMKTLAEMREAYAKAFGDDPKAPKAKSYEAFALTKIRKEQGEEAFQSKLQEYIERNQGIHAAKPAKATRKKVAIATNAVTTAGPVNRSNSRQKLIESVRTIATSAKDLIDNLVSTTMSLAKTNTGDMTSIATQAVNAANGTAKRRKTRSNKGKTHKKSAVKLNNSA
jgi:hypothetical protein